MVEAKPPTGMDKSSSQKLLDESSKEDVASGKGLARNESAGPVGSTPL